MLCQNENGPCPLLAICNALILQGRFALPAGRTEIEGSELQALLVGYIVDRSAQVDSADISWQHQVNDVIQLVQDGRLLQGLVRCSVLGKRWISLSARHWALHT